MEEGLEQVGKDEFAGGEGEEEFHSEGQYLHRRDVLWNVLDMTKADL